MWLAHHRKEPSSWLASWVRQPYRTESTRRPIGHGHRSVRKERLAPLLLSAIAREDLAPKKRASRAWEELEEQQLSLVSDGTSSLAIAIAVARAIVVEEAAIHVARLAEVFTWAVAVGLAE